MNNINILLRNGYIFVPTHFDHSSEPEALATVLMNLEYYGFSLSADAFRVVRTMSTEALSLWWTHLEPELKAITGDDRNIGDFVVYKNFPAEVLEKTQGEYWLAQILMYWGLPNYLFTQEEEPRKDLNPEERKSKTLMLASPSTLQSVLDRLLTAKARWKLDEFDDVLFLCKEQYVDFSKIQFKENLVALASHFINEGATINVKTATDVLRLAAGLSDSDVSLREKVKFKSFNRKTRRFFMDMLQNCDNIAEDVARRQGAWKRFFHNLHPGDFKKTHARVVEVADALYKGNLVTFNSRVEVGIKEKNPEVLTLLSARPGEFMRRLVHVLDVFGDDAADAFIRVIPKLSVHQIVSIRRLLEISGTRLYRVFPPKGNWAKLQVGAPRPVNQDLVEKLTKAFGAALAERVPAVRVLDEATECVKLPNNGGDEGEYPRGTTFKIPDEVKFIRTASYWEKKSLGSVWFDNGWNFFDENWNSVGVCCWDVNRLGDAAIFSGDPTNSKEMKGRAAQMIDLYPDKLLKMGVRYAVWNVLCYSHIPFSQATEVFAALQWGVEPQEGKLFEPSRCQIALPLKGDYKTKYVAVLDLKTRELVYIDANLKANVHSANSNGDTLSKQMPAFMEYIYSLPTVYDLFRESLDKDAKGQVLYSSDGVELDADASAYIFQHQGDQDYAPIDLNKILGG